MAADFGVAEMLQAEYERFVNGLAELSDGGQRAARAAAARITPTSTAVRTINIPGWDDVIHLTPRPTITPEMRAAHYAARQAGRPSPLAPELQDEIARRGRRARAMQSSAAPEYAKSYGQVMTAIDNVQDFLTTVTTTGRFILSGSARLLDVLSGTATVGAEEAARAAARNEVLARFAVREAAGEFVTRAAAREAAAVASERAALRVGLGLGGRTIGRLVPILGPILLLADILKALNLIGMWLFPGYALLCGGPGAGLAAAGLPVGQSLLGKRAGKQKVSQLGRLNVFSRAARLDRSNTLRSWRPSIYNLMEVAQTTDQLFGVGISFGGLVGMVSDAAFGVEQQLRGRDVRVNLTEPAMNMHRILAPGLRPVPTAALPDYRAASNVLAHGPIFQRVNDVFTLEEHMDALAAQYAAWSFLRPILELPAMEQAVNVALDHFWPPPLPQYLDSRVLALQETGEWAGEGQWPVPGAPHVLKGEQILQLGLPQIPAALLELEAHYPEEPGCAFIEALASALVDRVAVIVTGHERGVRLSWRPEWDLLESLALAGRVPVPDAEPDAIDAWWTSCLALMERTGDRMLTADELDQLAHQVGLVLLRAQLNTPSR